VTRNFGLESDHSWFYALVSFVPRNPSAKIAAAEQVELEGPGLLGGVPDVPDRAEEAVEGGAEQQEVVGVVPVSEEDMGGTTNINEM